MSVLELFESIHGVKVYISTLTMHNKMLAVIHFLILFPPVTRSFVFVKNMEDQDENFVTTHEMPEAVGRKMQCFYQNLGTRRSHFKIYSDSGT